LTTTTLTTTLLSFNCSKGSEERWSDDKKDWCCLHKQRACSTPTTRTTTTSSLRLDCSAGVQHWKEEWSKFKQEWCCQNQGFPCEDKVPTGKNASLAEQVATPGNDSHVSAPKPDAESEPREYHGKSGFPVNTTSETSSAAKESHGGEDDSYNCSIGVEETYDCKHGIMDWKHLWTVRKRQWCCTHALDWCPPDEFDNTTHTNRSASTQDWSPKHRDWCCKNKRVGCDPRNDLSKVAVKVDQQHQQLGESRGSANTRRWAAAAASSLGLTAAAAALLLALAARAGRARVRALNCRDVGLLPGDGGAE
jgi:hypothetical protein